MSGKCQEFYILTWWSWNVWSRCIFFAKFIKFSAPIQSGKFELVSEKCQGIVVSPKCMNHVLPEHVFPPFPLILLHTRICAVSTDWLTISLIVMIRWLSLCLFHILIKKKRKLQETSAIFGRFRKDLTTCKDTSTICVNLSPKLYFVWLAL